MHPRAGFFRITVLFVGELLLVGLALFGMDALGHLRLEVAQFSAAWGAWAVVLLGARVMRSRPVLPTWCAGVVEAIAPGFFLNELATWGRGSFTIAQVLYALLLVAALVRGWRAWVAWLDRRGGDVTGGAPRVLIVGAGAVTVTFPLFTDRLVGGIDARWYSYMLGDFIAQLRAGVFPVFIGQGELACNGGVHPFRSAPVFMHLAGFWDVLTFRTLEACALEHLAAITAALVGGLGMYAAGVALIPRRKWEAAAVALLYLAAPASLEALYLADAYMTWMALAALPLVFYGNARVLLAGDGRGYVSIAAGLALVWMCHPPIAMQATMATLLLQGGGLLCGDVSASRLRAAALGAMLFVGLAAYYFFSMSELPQPKDERLIADAFQMGGLILWLAGFASAVLRRRGAWWLVLLVPGGWLLWIGRAPWLWWMVATSLLAGAIVALARWRRWFDPAERAIEILFPCALLAAGVTQAWMGPNHPARDIARLQDLDLTTAPSWHYFLQLSPLVNQPADWQPGLGLWLALVALAVAFFRATPLAAKLWFAVASLPLYILVRAPWVSDFLIGYAPRWFAATAGLTFTLRLMPMLAALLAVGWFVWLAVQREGRKLSLLTGGVLFALTAAWSGIEAAKIVRLGARAVATRVATEKQFRSENVVLDRFAYDLLPMPTYYSNGIADARLEVRAIDESRQVRIDSNVTALRMEESARTELHLVCLPYAPPDPAWLGLGPSLTLSPGEHVLLRFEFEARRNYSGYLFMISANGYREYALPESGLSRAFGTTEKASRVISLWNSGTVAEKYEFSFRRGPGCTLPSDGSAFAKVVVSHYVPSRALVRVDSLIPFRATAAMSWPGFVETSRVWLPGYEATVDGKPASVLSSVERLAMVPVPAGLHTVELRYVGTTKLWTTWWISACTWGGLLGCGIWRLKKNL